MNRIRFLFSLLAVIVAGDVHAALPPVRIMPLGDSITSGCCDFTGAYRTRLYAALANAGYTIDFIGTARDTNNPALPDVNHEGHGGFLIHEIDAGVDTWLASVEDPDVVLLLIGTNDFQNRFDTANAKNRLETLIARIAMRRPFARIIVANLLLRTDFPELDAEIQTVYNPAIPGIVANQASLGRHVTFLDIRSVVGPADLADGLHPNLSGWTKMGDAWFSAVTQVISPTGTTDPPAIARVVGDVDLRHVIVTFSKPVADTAASIGNYTISGGVTVLGASLDAATKRVVTLTTTAQSPSFSYTLTVNGVRDRTPQQNLIAPNTTAVFMAAPIAEAASYSLVYSLNIPNQANFNTTGVPYTVDNRASIGPFSRIAYYLELQEPNRALQYLWVSVDAFTSDPAKIGVPTIQTGAFFQQKVAGMNVRSSVPGIVTGDGLTGGNIEFWPSDYGPANELALPGSSSTLYDWDDAAGPTDPAGYGSMQVHNHLAGQTLFAYNDWGGIGWIGDLGMGNYTGTHKDWTYAQNASVYVTKRLRVFVLPGTTSRVLTVNSSNPSTGVAVTVSPADNTGAGNGVTGFTRTYPHGTVVSLTAPATAGLNSFVKWQRNGVDYSLNRSISVTMDATYTLTAVYSIGALAPKNVPEAANYTLVYSLDLPAAANYNTTGVPYEIDNRASAGAFNRVAYYLELQQSGGPVHYLWVSMNAFTTDVNRIGVPSAQTGVFLQQNVSAMNVRSSVPGIVTGDGLTTGNIEFWASNYGQGNQVNVPNASATIYDWGDAAFSTDIGYGSMQVHNYDARQTLFAFNGWGGVSGFVVDLGLGNFTGQNSDWTFAQNAGGYVYKKLQVYVSNGTAPPPTTFTLTVNSSNPTTGVPITVVPADSTGAANGVTAFTRTYASGAIVSLAAPATFGGNTFVKWQRNGVDFSTGTSINLTVTANTTLTAVYATPAPSTFTLTVNSSNPNSGVAVTVSPADTTGAGNGVTGFTRTYASGATVNLAAPSTAGGNTFVKWQRNGVDFSTSLATSVAMNASYSMTAVYAPGPLAPRNVPEAANYTLIYSLNLPNSASYNTTGVPYELANRTAAGTFNRIAYYVELQQSGGPVHYLWTSMNAFTTDVNKIGVPSIQAAAFFAQNVSGLNVRSSVPGIVTGDGLSAGAIEFFSGSYGPENTRGVPGASSTLFDWGDRSDPNSTGYGCMQIHNVGAGQVLFAFNGWGNYPGFGPELGIGNFTGANPDWTYAQNAATYVYKKLQVYVANVTVPPPAVFTLAVNSSNPASGVNVTVSPADRNALGSGATPFNRSYNSGTVVTLSAPATAGSNNFQKWQVNGADFSTSTSISLTMNANTTATAVYVTPAPVVFTLAVNSSNPASGVNVTVSPADRNALGSGATPFNRSYNSGTVVTLSAPATAGSNNFQKWQVNGADFSTSTSISLTMNANITATAVYVTPAPVVFTLAVNSSNPASGVNVTVSPADRNALGSGATPFNRSYNSGTVVTLSAPATAGSNNFQKWQVNGADFSTSTSISLTMNANTTATAVYVTPAPVVFTLAVNSSNPASGVNVTVSPADRNALGSGATPFNRSYNSGTVVTLSAPATAGSNNFQKWQVNGADFSTSTSISLTMNANITATAVYVTPSAVVYTLTVTSTRPSSGVSITVSPADRNGLANGLTPFNRSYTSGTVVTLTAPSTVGGRRFRQWEQDGVNVGSSRTVTVAMGAAHTMRAVY